MVELNNVRKEFNKTVAVDDLSFEVSAGTVFGLLGPNGAGKTTTIRMIMNIIKPDRGVIKIDGAPLKPQSFAKIGYLPEERGLYQKRRLRETVVYLARLKGMNPAEAGTQTDICLERFSLTDYRDRKIEELSKGNQQKLQFIIAILHRPEIIILDEPFAGLDPVNQLLMKEIIAEFRQDGKTVIFSTHQMEQVEKLCDHLCLINRGRKVLYGDLPTIKSNYGTHRFHVRFEGSQQALLDCIAPQWTVTDNTLSGILDKQTALNDVLQIMLPRVTVVSVETEEPTLENIFIELVKGKVEA